MLQQFHSELGEVAKFDNFARYNAFIKKWHVKTNEELKGQGIKFFEKVYNKNVYLVTPKAFEKLCNRMDISQEILFD